MQLNQRFRIRQDLEEWMVYFKNEGPLEMPEISAFITGLLAEPHSRGELIEKVKEQYPEVDAKVEVDDMLELYRKLRLLPDQ